MMMSTLSSCSESMSSEEKEEGFIIEVTGSSQTPRKSTTNSDANYRLNTVSTQSETQLKDGISSVPLVSPKGSKTIPRNLRESYLQDDTFKIRVEKVLGQSPGARTTGRRSSTNVMESPKFSSPTVRFEP